MRARAEETAAEAKTRAAELSAEARSRAEQIAADAAAKAERVLAEATAQASQLAADAKTQAERLIADGTTQAEQTLARAAADRDALTAQAESLRAEAVRIRDGAAQAAADARTAARAEYDQKLVQLTSRLAAVEQQQARIDERELRLASEAERLTERDKRIATAEAGLASREAQLAEQEVVLAEAHDERLKELSRVAGLTADAAKAELVSTLEGQAKRQAAVLIRDIEADARSTAETRARHIVVDAIQRVASEQTAESVVSVLHLPSDEMKGRIIGREGRNIRAFESVTGVNLIIDDTPEAVLLSCFDPVRREIGRVTLEKLVLDGRIHPHRIEEIHDLAKYEVEKLCRRAAEDALVEVGITSIHPELIGLLGRLRYRTSYGQNVLKHLVETAHIAGIMAAELGLKPDLIKRGAFLHDIGKALTHEVEGSHALIGAEVARRYGEPEEVVHAIEAHHNEVQPQTIEAVLTQASDSCSGGRPGARRESLEAYVKRLERIEEIAGDREGVDKVFAMQAGREIRVMVKPDDVDDIGAAVLARDVAKQIEDELTYPGQIRVTVVRESRVSEIAR
nr:ribonuclease Y [Longispora albida]